MSKLDRSHMQQCLGSYEGKLNFHELFTNKMLYEKLKNKAARKFASQMQSPTKPVTSSRYAKKKNATKFRLNAKNPIFKKDTSRFNIIKHSARREISRNTSWKKTQQGEANQSNDFVTLSSRNETLNSWRSFSRNSDSSLPSVFSNSHQHLINSQMSSNHKFLKFFDQKFWKIKGITVEGSYNLEKNLWFFCELLVSSNCFIHSISFKFTTVLDYVAKLKSPRSKTPKSELLEYLNKRVKANRASKQAQQKSDIYNPGCLSSRLTRSVSRPQIDNFKTIYPSIHNSPSKSTLKSYGFSNKGFNSHHHKSVDNLKKSAESKKDNVKLPRVDSRWKLIIDPFTHSPMFKNIKKSIKFTDCLKEVPSLKLRKFKFKKSRLEENIDGVVQRAKKFNIDLPKNLNLAGEVKPTVDS